MYSPPRCEARLGGVNRVRPRPRCLFRFWTWGRRRRRRRLGRAMLFSFFYVPGVSFYTAIHSVGTLILLTETVGYDGS